MPKSLVVDHRIEVIARMLMLGVMWMMPRLLCRRARESLRIPVGKMLCTWLYSMPCEIHRSLVQVTTTFPVDDDADKYGCQSS